MSDENDNAKKGNDVTPAAALSAAKATLAFVIGEAAQAYGQINVIALVTRVTRLECQLDAVIDVLGSDPELMTAYQIAATRRMLAIAEKVRTPSIQIAKTVN